MMIRLEYWPLPQRILVIGLCVALLAGCSKLTRANYDRLALGQSRAEVESLLGAPESCAGLVGIESCTWGDKTRYVSVQFAVGKVVFFNAEGLE